MIKKIINKILLFVPIFLLASCRPPADCDFDNPPKIDHFFNYLFTKGTAREGDFEELSVNMSKNEALHKMHTYGTHVQSIINKDGKKIETWLYKTSSLPPKIYLLFFYNEKLLQWNSFKALDKDLKLKVSRILDDVKRRTLPEN